MLREECSEGQEYTEEARPSESLACSEEPVRAIIARQINRISRITPANVQTSVYATTLAPVSLINAMVGV